MAETARYLSGITCKGLGKIYGGAKAVDDVNLHIDPGELVVFVGPSGCGKTTTLRMLAGFVQPSSGAIMIGDRDVTRLPPRSRNIGMVFQDYALFPSMTVRENIAFGLEERRVGKPAVAERVDEMLALIRMEQMADRLPRELSGGQQQRVALARALAYHPAVLLMDEPLGALDQKLREEMQREIVTIQKRLGITTIFVTHDQQEAMALADRIVVMNGGRVEQIGRADDVYDAPVSLFTATFIGRSNQLHGKVVEVLGPKVRVALDEGSSIIARTGAERLSAGKAVTCIVRPEHLQLYNDGSPHLDNDGRPDNALPVTLERASRLGSFVDIIARTNGGTELVVQVPSDKASDTMRHGSVTATFGSDQVTAFPRGGGG